MKKRFITLLTLVCMLCCALGLVACGESSDSGKLKGDEFASAVETAMKSDNYTLSYYWTNPGSTVKDLIYTWTVDKTNERYFQNAEGVNAPVSQKYGYSKENGKCFLYEYSNAWEKMDILEALFIDPTEDLLLGTLGFNQAELESYIQTAAKTKASDFTYDRTTGKYTATGEATGNSDVGSITVTVEDGKVTAIDLNRVKGDYYEMYCTYSDFGTTEVELPENVHMAASEWADTLNAFKEIPTNFSFTMSTGSGNSEKVLGRFMLDGTTCNVNYDYYIKEGETYYKYARDYSSYAHSYFHWEAITESEYESAVIEDCYDEVANIVALVVPKLIEVYEDISGVGVYYHSAELELAPGVKLKDIAITVENGAVMEVECVMVGDGTSANPDQNIHIFNIGTTEIAYPTPAFQTFVLKSVEDTNGYATDFVATLQAQIGKTIIFAEDGSVKGTCDLGFGVFDDLDAGISVSYSVYLSTGSSSFSGDANVDCRVSGLGNDIGLSGYYYAPTFSQPGTELRLVLNFQWDDTFDGVIQFIFELA